MTKKIYVEHDYDGLYGSFWENLGEISRDRKEFLNHPERFDLVCFTGGEDVSPELYGHRNIQSGCSARRDATEQEVFEVARKHNIPMFSICRGAQLTSVLCGGSMVQHLSKSHGGGRHLCETFDGQEFEVTSSHHQMIVPGINGRVLGWAAERLHPEDCVYDGELPGVVFDTENPELIRVTEIVFYPRERALCCQSHPEWQDIEDPFPQYILALGRQLCWGEGERELTA